jgi:hypothetical protein
MVEHQCGTLSNISDGEVVEDITDTSLDAPLSDKMTSEEMADMLKNAPSTKELDQKPEGDVPPSNHEISMPEGVIPPVDEPVEEEDGILPDLDTENWMSQLTEDEIFNAEKGPAPRLHGLRRLAKPYILMEESKVNALIVVPREHVRTLTTLNGNGDVMSQSEQIGLYRFPMASVTFNITLLDGRTFSDSADAFFSNCEELGLFPTAVASARAEARCLRKVLGIREHAAEELVDKDSGEELAPDDDSSIKPEQGKLIDKMLKSVEISLKDLLESITTREIHSVGELTTGEARIAIRQLNDIKKKNKKKVKKS